MNLEISLSSKKDKNQNDIDNSKDYPTLADLIRQQGVSSDVSNTVHYRRDLDSLG